MAAENGSGTSLTGAFARRFPTDEPFGGKGQDQTIPIQLAGDARRTAGKRERTPRAEFPFENRDHPPWAATEIHPLPSAGNQKPLSIRRETHTQSGGRDIRRCSSTTRQQGAGDRQRGLHFGERFARIRCRVRRCMFRRRAVSDTLRSQSS